MSEEVTNLEQTVNEEVSFDDVDTQDAGSMDFDDLDVALDDNQGESAESKKDVSEEKVEDKPPITGESQEEEIKSSEKETEQDTEEEEQIEEIKKLIAKFGDEETELAANAIFKHKIDGEDVDVELQELLNNYSGKVSYEKKFQELSGKKKEFETFKNDYDTDIETIYGVISGFRDSMKNNDGLGALQHFADFAGMKPYEFQTALMESLTPEIVRRANLSEEQLLAEKLQSENNYLRSHQESEQAKLDQQQLRQELEIEIKQIQEAHSITEDAFNESYRTLVDTGYEGEINPQAVADFHIHYTAFSKSDSILNQVSESLAENPEIVENLQKVIVENPQFDDNDLLEIVNDVYGDYINNISKKVSTKVAKTAPKKKQTVNPSQVEVQDHLDWEDL